MLYRSVRSAIPAASLAVATWALLVSSCGTAGTEGPAAAETTAADTTTTTASDVLPPAPGIDSVRCRAWMLPDGAEQTSQAVFWGGDTPSAAWSAAEETAGGWPVVWTGENLGIGLDPPRDVKRSDVISLLARAAEATDDHPVRVTVRFVMRPSEALLDWLPPVHADEMLADLSVHWAAAGVVNPEGDWFLDIADMDSDPATPLMRIGSVDGQSFSVPVQSPCASVGAGGDDDEWEAPVTPFAETGGMQQIISPSGWRDLVASALLPELKALLDVPYAQTVPGVGDVLQVGVVADWSAAESAVSALADLSIEPDGRDGPEWGDYDPAFVVEIGSDGTLLSARADAAAALQQAFAEDGTAALLEMMRGVLADEQDVDPDGEPAPLVDEASWAFTWFPAPRFAAAEESDPVWEWP